MTRLRALLFAPLLAATLCAAADYPARPMIDRQLRVQGSEPRPTTPGELAKFMRVEHARWERVVRATGIQLQ